jgi:hypothetical protein
MKEENAKYFGLFLAHPRIDRDEDDDDPSSSLSLAVHFNMLCMFTYHSSKHINPFLLGIRWLKNFESPFISQQLANVNSKEQGRLHKILVHRVIWDPSVEEPLLDDPGSLKILYLQVKMLHKYSCC